MSLTSFSQVTDTLSIDDRRLEQRNFDNLKEKYSGNEFIYERTVETSGWWSRFKRWIAELFNFRTGQSTSDIMDLVFWIGASIIFLLVLFFLFKAIINKEGRWVFGKNSSKSVVPVTDVETNLHATDFKKLITEAELQNNYRLAIRYYYLWLLKKLAASNIIEYDVEKTNSDYAYEIKPEEVRNQFNYTSYLYNYIWYGEFDVDQSKFNKAKDAFNRFLNAIKS